MTGDVVDLYEATLAAANARNPVDVHVGARVRLRRRQINQSQDALAAALELTFQQVQKYEKGINRISASKLYAISRAQQTPLSFYFDGLPGPEDSAEPAISPLTAFPNLAGATALATAYIALPPSGRRALLHVAGAIMDVHEKLPEADLGEAAAAAQASAMSL